TASPIASVGLRCGILPAEPAGSFGRTRSLIRKQIGVRLNRFVVMSAPTEPPRHALVPSKIRRRAPSTLRAMRRRLARRYELVTSSLDTTSTGLGMVALDIAFQASRREPATGPHGP